MVFPNIVKKLLDCPGLLRLRKIGMGNVQYIKFPSYPTVNRYEHSLGACYLAILTSKSLGLSDKDSIEIATAALYHDIMTPPFAHTMEEILKEQFNFDHEKHFYRLLTGKSDDIGHTYSQVYLGKQLKLPRVFQSKEALELNLDLFMIPKLVFGDTKIRLSTLINYDIDLDNIDNITRVGHSMGFKSADRNMAENLAKSYVFYDENKIGISDAATNLIEQWKNIRTSLYDMFLCSMEDFSLQTMLKHAINCLVDSKNDKIRLKENDWKLTEEQFYFEKFNKDTKTKDIIKRIELRKLYDCLTRVWIEGPDIKETIKKKQKDLENIATDMFRVNTILNYYYDNRYREIKRPYVSFDSKLFEVDNKEMNQSMLVGFFTPDNIYFNNKTGKRHINKKLKNNFVEKIREELPKSIKLFNIKCIQNEYPHLETSSEIK